MSYIMNQNLIHFKTCPKCQGDQQQTDEDGFITLVCVNCGMRTYQEPTGQKAKEVKKLRRLKARVQEIKDETSYGYREVG